MAHYILSGPVEIQTISGLTAARYSIQRHNGTAYVDVSNNFFHNKGCILEWSIDQAAQGMFFCTNWNGSSCQGHSTQYESVPFILSGSGTEAYSSLWVVVPAVTYEYRIALRVQIYNCSNHNDNPTTSPYVTLIQNNHLDPYVTLKPPIIGGIGQYSPNFPDHCKFDIVGFPLIKCGSTAYFHSSNISLFGEQYVYQISSPRWRLIPSSDGLSIGIRAPSLTTIVRYPQEFQATFCIQRTLDDCNLVRCMKLTAICTTTTKHGNKYNGLTFTDIDRIRPIMLKQ